ncbi:RPM1-interacting protein 4-like [Solanum pennellii]|uniref:RPM1-interacting protein 4-like n=1 Tax=Solanum pennellii TaxID=28526 RepID=A0ABM1GWN7_SOLPN|nr:RPM1-interacting protein 4-like [Solanum pennellii]
MARANVPKFGNWGNEDNTPYTVVFENARKNRGGKMINPNDPQENPDMFPNVAPSSRPKTPTEEPMGMETARQTNKRRVSKEDGDFRASSPARNEPTTHQRHGGGRGSNSGRPSRQSGGSDHSIAKSPLHPNSQAKISGRVAASPVWEGKNLYDSSHGTPGRSFESSHATPGRHQTKQESPDRGTVVPKFGGWDDNDPQDAENYTEVFNKVREQRHVDTGNMPAAGVRTSYSTQRQQRNEKQKSCCFPLW